MAKRLIFLFLVWTCTGALFAAHAAEIQIAVASNFSVPMAKINELFRNETGHVLIVSYGASTKLATQIKNGAPFVVFLSADQQEVRELIKADLAVVGTEFTYAVGKLALWSPKPGLALADGELLKRGDFKRLAIANSKLAPYGKAAREVMENLGVWQKYTARLITGENITQTHQFVASGNVDLGFVARSQIATQIKKSEGSVWLVPQSLYSPLKQDAVLLKKAKEKGGANAEIFLKFLKSQKIRDIIREFGYDLPND